MPTCAETAIIAPIVVDAAAPADVLSVGAASSTVDAGLGSRPLTESRRSTHEWEREASLLLRAGDPDMLRIYHQDGRLLDAGTREQAEQSADRAWLGDTLAPVDRPGNQVAVSEGIYRCGSAALRGESNGIVRCTFIVRIGDSGLTWSTDPGGVDHSRRRIYG